MSELLCVTDRKLCRGDFLERVEALAACRPRGIILREKDLPEQEYKVLAARAAVICKARGVNCILHSFVRTALALDTKALHVPMPVLRRMGEAQRGRFRILGASCHSAEEAREAEMLGCTYVTAGHIFATGCNPGGWSSCEGCAERCPSRCTPSAASGRTASPPSGRRGRRGPAS